MSTQRQPGIIGLWEDPFPTGDPLPAGDELDPLSAGPVAFTEADAGSVGLAAPDVSSGGSATPEVLGLTAGLALGAGLAFNTGEEDSEEEQQDATELLPDQHRIVKFMGTPIKVRCNAEWTDHARALGESDEPSEDEVKSFLEMVAALLPEMKQQVADMAGPFFRARGKADVADELDSLVSERSPRRGA